MKWNIVLDSSCDLRKEDAKGDIGFSVVPLSIIVGGREFVDDENLSIDELLSAMEIEKKASSSACPSPESFLEEFKKAENTICVTMTSALSGTNNSARIAKEMLAEISPEKNVHIIDSHSTAGKMVLMKRKAEDLIEEGKEFSEICDILDALNENLHLTFALGGYDNLIKTGRMSKIAGILATSLGIRAVAIATSAGEIEVVKKPRGENNAINAMADIMAETKNMQNMPIVISHCKNYEGALAAKEVFKTKLKTDDITIVDCKGLTTFYTMEKGLIIGY